MLGWIRSKLDERKAERREQARLSVETLHRRLLNPDFDLILRHFGAPISAPLRELYSDTTELVRDCVFKKHGPGEDDGLFAAWYIPLDEEALAEQWHRGEGRFDFADDGTASRLSVDPTDGAAEIFLFQHEDQTFHPTGVKMCDFLKLPET